MSPPTGKRRPGTVFIAFCVCGVAATLLVDRFHSELVVLEDAAPSDPAADPLPSSITDLMNLAKMDEKHDWMKTIIENAQGIKTLHPNADIDPFTKQPLTPETNQVPLIGAASSRTTRPFCGVLAGLQGAVGIEEDDSRRNGSRAVGQIPDAR